MKIPKQPNEAVNRTPMEPQKVRDTLSLLANYSADGKADGIYKNCGYQGCEQYELRVMDGLPFLLWKPENDQQIKNPNFKWQDFQAKPYISYESDSNGYTFIQAPAVVKRDKERFRTNRQQRYQEFIKSFSPETGSPLKLLAGIQGLHSMLEQQAARQIEQLESVDQELIRLLKVYRFETQQNILNTGSPETQTEQLQNFIIDTRHLYQWGIRHVANTETLLQHWIPKRIEQPFVPAPIGQSLMNGIKTLMPKKERILNSMIPIIEKLIHIETLKYYALNDMPLMDESRELPELNDKSVQRAIKDAIYRKTNSYGAKQFLSQYAPIHKQNPRITKADAIKQIRDLMPGITVSDRTLNAWINDYHDALNAY